ncbi:hypothetical protein [Pseudomonas sp. 25 R 14]|nr:hypothetical protein [Pseudomonas sp. 25 R 14]
MAQAALGLQAIDQLLERQVLPGLASQRGTTHLAQEVAKRQALAELSLEHLGIDEEANQALGLQPVTVGDGHADANIVLPAVAVQQSLERRQQQHKQRDLFALGQLFQRRAQLCAQRDLYLRTTVTLLGRTRMIGRQLQHGLLTAQLLQPICQLTLALAAVHPLALPQCVVGVLDRQGRQLHVLALAVTGIKFNQLIHSHFHRPTVGDDVVLSHDQHVVVGRQLQQFGPQQRTLMQVEQLAYFLVDPGLEPRIEICCRTEGFDGESQFHLGLNHLHGAPVFFDELCAQALMTRQQRVETALQCQHVQVPLQAQGQRQVVGDALRLQLPEEPLPLLGIGQVQYLVPRHRQQGRCRTSLFLTQGLDKGLQGAVFKQRTQRYFSVQQLPHPRHDLGGQQRVPAQFEEVVRQAHLRKLEHFLPDLRHLPLPFGARRHIGLLHLAGVRLGQGLAVQLAVGRQGQALHEQPVLRHHVVRQLLVQAVFQRFAQGVF